MELVSADHIAAQAGAFEPQRKNNFTLEIEIPGGTGIIQRALDKFPMPKESNEPIVVDFGNEQRKVAGRATYENLELVLKDFADQPVMKNVIAWRRTVYDPKTGKIFLAKNYKGQGTVKLFAPEGSLIRAWKLIGVWPSKLDPGEGSMGDNVNNMISVTLAIDKAIEDTNLK